MRNFTQLQKLFKIYYRHFRPQPFSHRFSLARTPENTLSANRQNRRPPSSRMHVCQPVQPVNTKGSMPQWEVGMDLNLMGGIAKFASETSWNQYEENIFHHHCIDCHDRSSCCRKGSTQQEQDSDICTQRLLEQE